jgi:hypothetical protein
LKQRYETIKPRNCAVLLGVFMLSWCFMKHQENGMATQTLNGKFDRKACVAAALSLLSLIL